MKLDILVFNYTLYTHLTFQIHSIDPNQTQTEKMLIGKWFQYIGEKEIANDHLKSQQKKEKFLLNIDLAYHQNEQRDMIRQKHYW